MQGSLEQPPIILRTRRTRGVWLFIGSALFVLAAISLPAMPEPGHLLTIIFFGLCCAVGLMLLAIPSRLEIGPVGFTQTVFGRIQSFTWDEVENFRIISPGYGPSSVAFDFLGNQPKRSPLQNKGSDFKKAKTWRWLQSGWEISPEALMSLLMDGQGRWLEAQVSALSQPSSKSVRTGFFMAIMRSRINRKVFWIATIAIVALAMAISHIPGMGQGGSSFTTLLFVRIYNGRLHDISRSGWWQLVLYGIQIPAMIVFGMIEKQPLYVTVDVGLLVQIIFMVTLGSIAGNFGPNRFGPPS